MAWNVQGTFCLNIPAASPRYRVRLLLNGYSGEHHGIAEQIVLKYFLLKWTSSPTSKKTIGDRFDRLIRFTYILPVAPSAMIEDDTGRA